MRETGYYWVKTKFMIVNDPLDIHNGWEVAFYEKNMGWCSIWDGGYIQDDELLEINETQLFSNNECNCTGFNGLYVHSETKCSNCHKEVKNIRI